MKFLVAIWTRYFIRAYRVLGMIPNNGFNSIISGMVVSPHFHIMPFVS